MAERPSSTIDVHCHPDTADRAQEVLLDAGYHYVATVHDLGMPAGVGVVWFGWRPQTITIGPRARHERRGG